MITLKVMEKYVTKTDEEGNELKSKVKTISNCYNPVNLEGPYQWISERYVPYKNRCLVNHKELGLLRVNEKYEDVRKKIERIEVKGFTRK